MMTISVKGFGNESRRLLIDVEVRSSWEVWFAFTERDVEIEDSVVGEIDGGRFHPVYFLGKNADVLEDPEIEIGGVTEEYGCKSEDSTVDSMNNPDWSSLSDNVSAYIGGNNGFMWIVEWFSKDWEVEFDEMIFEALKNGIVEDERKRDNDLTLSSLGDNLILLVKVDKFEKLV